MKITQVTINSRPEGPRVKAFATIVIDDSFAVHGIALRHGRDGYLMEMPGWNRPGKFTVDVAFPLNDETRQMILQAIVEKYEKVARD